MNYNVLYGDKKSIRYYFIKDLHNQYYQQLQSGLQGYSRSSLHDYEGSGLQGCAQDSMRSNSQSYTQQFIFLPSDPDEIVDQLKFLYFEKSRRE